MSVISPFFFSLLCYKRWAPFIFPHVVRSSSCVMPIPSVSYASYLSQELSRIKFMEQTFISCNKLPKKKKQKGRSYYIKFLDFCNNIFQRRLVLLILSFLFVRVQYGLCNTVTFPIQIFVIRIRFILHSACSSMIKL